MLSRSDALALAASEDSAVRAAAARELVPFEDDVTDQALFGLLNDPEDTAVTEAALDTVVERGTQRSVNLLLNMLATGDEEAVDHLMDFLDVRKHVLKESGFASRTAFALLSAQPGVAEGAREVMREMQWEAGSV